MNMEAYRNYISIVEEGSISSASRKGNISQPALSTQLKAFEQEFGAVLIKRGLRGLELTDAGRILYDKAVNMCKLEDAAHKEIDACMYGTKGTLSMAVSSMYLDPLFDKIWMKFQLENPDIQYITYELLSREILQLLKTGVIEIGIIRTPDYITPALDAQVVFEERLTAVFHKESNWLDPEYEMIDVSMLNKIPLSISMGFQAMITDLCMEQGFEPNFLHISSSRFVTLKCAKLRSTVAIIPASNLQNKDNELYYRPIAGKGAITKRALVTTKNRKLSAVAKKFLGYWEHELANNKNH